MSRPKIICLTPVKNEAWILERFLKCTSLWADYIIIADQNSDDGSREIAAKFPKVILIDNKSDSFNEPERQKMLLEAARKISGEKILIALDADEFLTPNFNKSSEWETIMAAKSGTVIRFQWANVRSDMQSYWIPPNQMPFGFVDDGSDHSGNPIHSPRIPLPVNSPTITLRDIKVLHYQFTDWERMESKHRWYQCWERIHDPARSAVSIYRQYHHMYAVCDKDITIMPKWWMDEYAKYGIDMTSIYRDRAYRWDKEVLEFINQYGAKFFAHESIWEVDWKSVAQSYGYNELNKYRDPRSNLSKKIHRWLERTQPQAYKLHVRLVDKILRKLLGW